MKPTSKESQRLDREITIQTFSASQNDFGEEILSWSTLVTCWASAEWPMAHNDEKQEAQQETATERIDFTVRYVDASTARPKMRVSYNSKYYDILTVTPLGRQRYLILKCETKD